VYGKAGGAAAQASRERTPGGNPTADEAVVDIVTVFGAAVFGATVFGANVPSHGALGLKMGEAPGAAGG
jgi:hypothetical protein